MEPAEDVTALLLEWSEGDRDSMESLVPLIYGELHRQARLYLSRERTGHTLQPTALVHEVYLRLVDQKRVRWRNRAHFFGVSARLMRRILVDHARRRRAAKRGGEVRKVAIDEARDAGDVAGAGEVDVLALDEALSALAELDPRQSRVVELRFFAGLEVREVAEVMDISPATVKREWSVARAWLLRRLSRG